MSRCKEQQGGKHTSRTGANRRDEHGEERHASEEYLVRHGSYEVAAQRCRCLLDWSKVEWPLRERHQKLSQSKRAVSEAANHGVIVNES